MKIEPRLQRSITQRLNQAIGIDTHALDERRLRWIIGSRCRELKLADATAYEIHLSNSPAELDFLIDEVVVQETRFLRDPVVYDHIRSTIGSIATKGADLIRMLSAPCGTGQEAYSLATVAQLAGLPASRFTIDAFDISLSALEIAGRGVYPWGALSHVSEQWRQVFGKNQNQQWTVHDVLRDRISFARCNLAQQGVLGNVPRYHLILCRNLFIYLSPAARAALAQSLATSLLPDGRLFLGTADRVEELQPLFAPVRPAGSFAFTHRRTGAAPGKRVVRVPRSETVPLIPRKPVNNEGVPSDVVESVEPASSIAGTAEALLARALEERQRGCFAKAERSCRQALYLAPDLLPALELLQTLWHENANLRLRHALRDRILRNQFQRKLAGTAIQVVAVDSALEKERS